MQSERECPEVQGPRQNVEHIALLTVSFGPGEERETGTEDLTSSGLKAVNFPCFCVRCLLSDTKVHLQSNPGSAPEGRTCARLAKL